MRRPVSCINSPLPFETKPGELYLARDDWDFDFDGAVVPKGNKPIEPNLSNDFSWLESNLPNDFSWLEPNLPNDFSWFTLGGTGPLGFGQM